MSVVTATDLAHQPVTWLTNYDSKSIQTMGLDIDRFLPHNFLRITYGLLSHDLGVREDTDAKRVQTLSEMFKRVLDLYWYAASTAQVSGGRIVNSLTEILNPPSVVTGKIATHFKSAHQTSVSLENEKRKPGDISAVFRIPRHFLCEHILRSYYPVGDWQEFSASKSTHPNLEEYLINLSAERPVIVELHNSSTMPSDQSALFGLNGSLDNSRVQRRFMTMPEYRVAAPIMAHSVTRFWVGSGYRRAVDDLPDGHKFDALLRSPHTLNWSAGLVLENVRAALSQTPKHIAEQATTEELCNVRALWLDSIERMQLLNYAKRMRSAGIRVFNFQAGGLYIYAGEEEIDSILRTCMKLGLWPPLSLSMKNPMYLDQDQWPGRKEDSLLAFLLYGGMREEILQLSNPSAMLDNPDLPKILSKAVERML